MVFLDLKKAFDIMDYDILAKRLSFMEYEKMELRWFKSHLHDRQQLCTVNGISSYLQYIKCGVPQESCLESLLFLLFINNMPLSLHNSKVTMYADDTSFAYASSGIDDITKSMNAELENLRKWLHGYQLTLNSAKTTSMIIDTDRKLHESDSRELIQEHFKISGEAIEHRTSAKYLRIIFK